MPHLPSTAFSPYTQTLSILRAAHCEDLAVRHAADDEGDLVLITAVLDQLPRHPRVLYHLGENSSS